MNAFEKWFRAQFGYREAPGSPDDKELHRIVIAGIDAQEELTRRQRYDAEYRAASYARNAAPDFNH